MPSLLLLLCCYCYYYCCWLVVVWGYKEKLSPLPSNSLFLPYLDQDALRIRNWEYGGSTVINVQKGIRLTPEKKARTGWLWNKVPMPEEAWQVEFEFKVHGEHTYNYGDGFALWVVKEPQFPGPVFGAANNFQGLGVFFDTFHNGGHYGARFPRISVMLGDGKIGYHHDSDGEDTELAACEVDFRGLHDHPCQARLTYYRDNQLSLELAYQDDGLWTKCFVLPDVVLPRGAKLAFSAHTGDLVDNHDLIYISTREILSPPPPKVMKEEGAKENIGTYDLQTEHGWVLLLFALSTTISMAYVVYSMKQKSSSSSLNYWKY